MKIGMLNLHCFHEDNLETKISRIIDTINECDFDVILFQEVAQLKANKIVKDNYKEGSKLLYIIEHLKCHYYSYFEAKKTGFDVLDEGQAILSKYPLLNKRWYHISNEKSLDSWKTRIALNADIKINDKLYTFSTIHLGWDDETEKYTDQVDALLEGLKDKEFFIGGDYNINQESPYYGYIKQQGVISVEDIIKLDTLNNPTFHFALDSGDTSKNRHIDFLFMNRKHKINEYKILLNTEETRVSDHYMIYIDIDI